MDGFLDSKLTILQKQTKDNHKIHIFDKSIHYRKITR